MVEITRHENESALAALRRFTKRLQQAGTLPEVRAHRFHERSSSPQKQKKSAMYRIKRHKEYERLKKLGKIEEKKRRR